jgi:hypothetical protein
VTFLRPGVSARLARWREAMASGAVIWAGIWVMSLGGWVYHPVGALIAIAGVCWAIVALRRLRFSRPVEAPGVITLDEGQVGYFGPVFGGVLSLDDLVELRIARRDGLVEWRLRGRDGSLLRIPVAALGSERLFDAFSVLPGVDMLDLTRVLDAPPGEGMSRPLWRRPGYDSPPALLPAAGAQQDVGMGGGRPAGRRQHHDLS